jgi:Cell Wall Hydrolase
MTYEQWLAALCLWREARGASVEALTAIWFVIVNRSQDAKLRWPRTIPGVILQFRQFSSFNAGDPNATKFPSPPLPGNPASPDWSAFLKCQEAVTTQLGSDLTNGATNYESEPPNQLPDWADPAKLTVTIAPFRFYKL